MNAHKKAINALQATIKDNFGRVVNTHVVLGALESYGIREADVYQDYGFPSMEALAEHIYFSLEHQFNGNSLENTATAIKRKKEDNLIRRIKNNVFMESFRDYSLGILHLTPIFLQIIAIILFGVSLWGYLFFNDLQATGVVLGVIIGLIGSGGFIQVMSRQLSFYRYQKDWEMIRLTVIKLLKLNFIAMMGLIGLLVFFNLVFSLYPIQFIGIVSVYALLIDLFLLVLAPFYTIRKRWAISIIVGLGTLLSILLFKYFMLSIFIIHWSTIAFCIVFALIYLEFVYQKMRKTEEQPTYKKPKLVLSIYTNFRYFIYGTLLFSFIFIDRILAWSTGSNRDLPYFIYYQKDYEIGMDLAIIVFFLLTGVLEYSITSFSRFLEFEQRQIKLTQLNTFKERAIQLYRRHLALFLFNGLAIALIIYFIISHPWGYQWAFGEQLSPTSLVVCILGGLAYFFLTLGMLNVLYLFTLNKQKKSLLNLGIAFLTNIGIGLVASRLFSFEYSVIGMLIGSMVFMFLTTRDTVQYFNKLDYYYYAAN